MNSDSDSDFDPRADESDTSSSTTTNGGGNKISNDLFGFEPPSKTTLGQQLFTTSAINHNLTNGLMMNGNGNGHQLSPPPLCKFIHKIVCMCVWV